MTWHSFFGHLYYTEQSPRGPALHRVYLRTEHTQT